jgi:hypothetical protein
MSRQRPPKRGVTTAEIEAEFAELEAKTQSWKKAKHKTKQDFRSAITPGHRSGTQINQQARKKRLDILHYLDSCNWEANEIDGNTLTLLIQLGRQDLVGIDQDLRLLRNPKNEPHQMELPGFRDGRIQEMVARAESLARALDFLEAEATQRGFTISPRQNGRIGKDAA